jgi:signal transduction histidine kinase
MAATAEEARSRLHRARPSEPLRLKVAGALVPALTAGFIVAGIARDAVALKAFQPQLIIWVFIAMGASAATLSFGRDRPALSMDLPVLLACSFVVGPLPAGAVALVATTDSAEWRGRISFPRAALNHAQVSLSVIAAGIVFRATGGHVGTWPHAVWSAGAGLMADVVVNYASVAFILVLATSQSFGQVLRSMRIGEPLPFAIEYLAFGLSGLLVAEVYSTVGFLGVAAFAGPVFLTRQAFVQTKRLREAARDLEIRRAALRRVDERIADERRDERARIAEALHDDVLQHVYNVSLRARVIKECYQSGRLLDLEIDVPAMMESSDRATEELRDVIHGLRRSRVGHAGVVDSLALLVSHLRDESGINIVAEMDHSLRTSPELELLVYQVVREALTNAVKHSAAGTIWLGLHSADDKITVTILDDGVGFDIDRPRDERHFGLELMGERVASIGGVLDIRAQPNCGVSIEASFPLPRI